MTQVTRRTNQAAEFHWPLTFDAFAFGAWVFNTLRCSIIVRNRQFALDDELHQPTGQPPLNWQKRWSASYIVAEDMIPPGPVDVRWTSLDGATHSIEIDLLSDVFPGRELRHEVPKEEVNKDWARYDKSIPDILMEVNDRVIRIYMRATVLTQLPPDPDRPDVFIRDDLVLAWAKSC